MNLLRLLLTQEESEAIDAMKRQFNTLWARQEYNRERRRRKLAHDRRTGGENDTMGTPPEGSDDSDSSS